jgi:hypothetical protein
MGVAWQAFEISGISFALRIKIVDSIDRIPISVYGDKSGPCLVKSAPGSFDR